MGADGVTELIEEVAGRRDVVVKAYTIGVDKADPLSDSDLDQSNPAATVKGAAISDQVEPPYNPDTLCRLFEHSNSLRQNVDAYETNIDGFGHTFDPVIQLKEAGSRDLVRDAIYQERYEAAKNGLPNALVSVALPTDVEVEAKIAVLQSEMRMERARAESFFDNCVAEESFTSLRRRTRQDIEVTGNGYWEVIRNDLGEITQFMHVPSRTMRVTALSRTVVDVPHRVRYGLINFRQEQFRRRFRRYVQIGGDRCTWFKEFGDPSVVSSASGKSHANAEALRKEEGEAAVPANEVFHFKIHALSTSAYGVPRWIGNLLSVLGSRAAEEVNLAYFDNKGIPPIAILVSGGRLGQESVKRIQDFFESKVRGRKNFHKVVVIEAETTAGAIGLGADNAGTMRVEIKQLTDAQLKDGLFLEYDSSNMDKVGMGFRLPRLLRGDIRDFNRSSAEAALDFAESQVFVPQRNEFDFAMNRHILPALGIKYWQFKSLGPRLSDSQSWGEMIAKLTLAGILTPEDARTLASNTVLSQELPIINADWVRQPLPLTIAGVQLDTALDNKIPLPGSAEADSTLSQPGLVGAARERIMRSARELVRLRDAFRKQEGEDAIERFKQQTADDGEIRFQMTAKEMEEVFGVTKT